MSTLITLSNVSKRHGVQTLFDGLSLTLSDSERLGIIGPNGAGKSTLLKVIADLTDIDSGTVLRKNDVRVSYAAQTAEFEDESLAVLEAALHAASRYAPGPAEQERLARSALSMMDIDFFDAAVASLSGGQRKRLQLALCLTENPDLLLLDEPTNHLDIEAIQALEQFLSRLRCPWIVVSHDRWFLENAVSRIAEVNPRFPGGIFVVDGGYGTYCERREQYVTALANQQDSLANVVRNETAWLRQGVKARGTKAKHRIDKAHALIESLETVRARGRGKAVGLEFEASDRKSKRLITFHSVHKQFGEKVILQKFDMVLAAGQALGVLGLNGSGKTTFVKLLSGELQPDSGTIKHAVDLTVAHFSQFDTAISADEELPLKFVLSENGENVIYRGSELHVASWARRFKFSFDHLQQPYRSLSGGEKARARLARLMLQTPDVLVLDEPTNDLDIETLEMLETSLIEFTGAVVLVTHDRFMINRVCSSFLGLDGSGNALPYAEYEQWEREVLLAKPEATKAVSAELREKPAQQVVAKKKLGYLEQRELDGMEAAISSAEQSVEGIQRRLSAAEPADLQTLCEELAVAQKRVETLYLRWEELEAKQN